MIAKKDPWADLTSLWQEQKGIDPDVLARAVKRRTLSMRVMTATELFFGAIGVVFGVWMMARNRGPFETGLGAFIVLFSGLGTFATVWARKGAWVADSSGLAGQLRLMLRRARAGVRLAIVNLWALVPAGIMISSILFYRWDAVIGADPAKQRELILIFGLGALALLGTGIWALWYKSRKRREIKRLEALLSDLEDKD